MPNTNRARHKQIHVALLPDAVRRVAALDVAVVIDALRFTSTACVALAQGARSIVVVSDIDQARGLVQQAGTELSALLCGERHCVRIPGFDLGNSPTEYVRSVVAGRDLIFSTTNGTLAVEASLAAREVLLGSLLNRRAVANWLRSLGRREDRAGGDASVWLVCSGTDGEVALEDVLTAGAIARALLDSDHEWQLANDSACIATELWQGVAGSGSLESIVDRLAVARGGRNLINAGFGHDLKAVAVLDSLNVVPVLGAERQPPRFAASDA